MNYRIFYTLLAVIVFSVIMLYGGTTGKLSGIITDAETGEPLYGVNVMLEGTSMGAASDFEGEFYILNIPPGTYNVKASMIGYGAKVIQQVAIQVDLTTRIDIELSSSAYQLEETVMVIAERKIQKDLTSSETSYSSEQIDELPVKDIATILSMQAGVVKDAGGNLHIRGGRTTEISYMIDGVQVINPVNRSSGISIDDQSIAELKAITGTFNAEYGQALSGVINIVTKTL